MALATSAALALLGGTGFRLVLGYVMERVKDWQEHSFEITRMKLDQLGEAARNEAYLKTLEAQKGLDIKTINVEGNPVLSISDLTFKDAVADVKQPTGFKWLDMWNSAIRPALATLCMVVWIFFLVQRGWVLTDWDLELIAATLGIFIGSRISHTGK